MNSTDVQGGYCGLEEHITLIRVRSVQVPEQKGLVKLNTGVFNGPTELVPDNR